jgi:hypothetical protein
MSRHELLPLVTQRGGSMKFLRDGLLVSVVVLMAFVASACSKGSSPVQPSQIGAAGLASGDVAPGGDVAPSVGRSVVIGPMSTSTPTPIVVDGNPTCASRGYAFELKFDPPNSGTQQATQIAGLNSITITTSDNVTYSWSSAFGIDAVIAKGGDQANLYVYDPESSADSGLTAPINPNTGKPFGMSHVSFCFDIELTVRKTATTTFTRNYGWTIAKSADQTTLTLSSDQTFIVNYSIVATKDAGVDSNWAVSGTITVTNPYQLGPANGVAVTDVISGSSGPPITVTCPSTTISAGQSIVCTYDSVSLPGGTERTNTATATATNLGSGTGTANVTFGAPSTKVDDCVTISDSYSGGPQGQSTCATKTFTYSRAIDAGILTCGVNTVENTATLTSDNGAPETDNHTVTVNKDCPPTGGCTLTQGYWRTHSDRGPAPYDNTWALLGGLAEDTIFYLSGKTYYQVLWTAPAGNAYYVLANQFIAAKLNGLAGSNTTAITDALAQADNLFRAHTPASVAGLKGTSAIRQQFLTLATQLDNYNNGVIGPGHCSE